MIDGVAYCVACESDGTRRPTDPQHPSSPFCEEHRRAARTANQRRWRQHKERAQRLLDEARDVGVYVSPDGYAVLPGEQIEVLLGDLETLERRLKAFKNSVVDLQPTPGQVAGALEGISGDLAERRVHWTNLLRPPGG